MRFFDPLAKRFHLRIDTEAVLSFELTTKVRKFVKPSKHLGEFVSARRFLLRKLVARNDLQDRARLVNGIEITHNLFRREVIADARDVVAVAPAMWVIEHVMNDAANIVDIERRDRRCVRNREGQYTVLDFRWEEALEVL